MSNPIENIHRIPDPEMYEAARTMRACFIEDKADFITFDSGTFSDPYSDDWLSLIEAAEALPTDEALDDDLTELSAEVETQMNLCREKFQDSKYFIEKTFPGNEPRWNKFGYDNYMDARRKQSLMITFMKNFHTVATKYKTELIANGYAQPKIDEIDALHTALIDANQAQELFIKDQREQTQDRHIANNKIWAVMTVTGSAGKRIYKNNFAKYQRYLLPEGEENPAAISITGLGTEQGTGNQLEGMKAKVLENGAEVLSKASGIYTLGGLAAGTYTVEYSKAGYVTQTISVTVPDGAPVTQNVVMVAV